MPDQPPIRPVRPAPPPGVRDRTLRYNAGPAPLPESQESFGAQSDSEDERAVRRPIQRAHDPEGKEAADALARFPYRQSLMAKYTPVLGNLLPPSGRSVSWDLPPLQTVATPSSNPFPTAEGIVAGFSAIGNEEELDAATKQADDEAADNGEWEMDVVGADEAGYGQLKSLLEQWKKLQHQKALIISPDKRPQFDSGADGYQSPFLADLRDAETAGLPEVAYRYQSAAAADAGLDKFLVEVAQSAPEDVLQEASAIQLLAMAATPHCARFFAEHPCFRVQDNVVSYVHAPVPCSFAPCVITGSTILPDGRIVSHMTSMLSYMFLSQGNMRQIWHSVTTTGMHISYNSIVGDGEAIPPAPAADSISLPGLYTINPSGYLIYVGMTHSLGIARRTSQYDTAVYGVGGKMGTVQTRDSGFPGTKRALMWHGSVLPGLERPIPAAAVYAAETIMILATGSWATSLADINRHLDDYRGGGLNADGGTTRPFGLNTNIFDSSSQCLRSSALNSSGADELTARLLRRVQEADKTLPVWQPSESSSPDGRQVEAFYRTICKGIIPPEASMSAIYSHVRFRSKIMMRAVAKRRDVDKVKLAHLVPGKNTFLWLRRHSL